MEKPQENIPKKEESGYDIKKYSIIALMVFITFCCCILFTAIMDSQNIGRS